MSLTCTVVFMNNLISPVISAKRTSQSMPQSLNKSAEYFFPLKFGFTLRLQFSRGKYIRWFFFFFVNKELYRNFSSWLIWKCTTASWAMQDALNIHQFSLNYVQRRDLSKINIFMQMETVFFYEKIQRPKGILSNRKIICSWSDKLSDSGNLQFIGSCGWNWSPRWDTLFS